MTWSFPTDFVTLQNMVISKARLDSTNDLDKVKAWINQAYYTACVETEFFESSATATTLTAGQRSVTVPAAIVIIDYIVPTGSDGALWGPMDLVTFEEILENRAWAASTPTTGAPSRYAFRSSSSATIEIWPDAAGGEVLTFYGAELPTALSANGDTPIFPEPYASKVLEYGALYEAAQYKKDLFFLSNYQAAYQEWTARLRAFNNTRVGDKTQQFKVEKQRPYPRGNGVDTGLYY